jgi:hypothetical protein
MSERNLFEVIGEGFYEPETDDLFLPDIDPEDAVGWPETDDQDEDEYRIQDEILSSLEASYGTTHVSYYDGEEYGYNG